MPGNWIRMTALKPKVILAVWIALSLGFSLKQLTRSSYNNYKIFKGVFWHTVNQTPLYEEYPQEYFDRNHYGPFFSVVIAPFALMPDWLGVLLWNLFNALLLYYAIFALPIDDTLKCIVAWLVTNELATSLANQQSNPALAAAILLSFTYTNRHKEHLSAFFIISGFWVKLYSIVGLITFFFTKKKARYIFFAVLFGIMCAALPMILASPKFVIQSYNDWMHILIMKDTLNQTSSYQDISLIGIIRRTTGIPSLSSLYFIIPSGILAIAAFFWKHHYQQFGFQLLALLAVMIGVNIFSSSSESSTYIIGFSAVAIWFVMHQPPYSTTLLILMAFAFLLTSLSPTDLFPQVARTFVREYSLKAAPCVLIWFYIIWQMVTYPKQKALRKEFQFQ